MIYSGGECLKPSLLHDYVIILCSPKWKRVHAKEEFDASAASVKKEKLMLVEGLKESSEELVGFGLEIKIKTLINVFVWLTSMILRYVIYNLVCSCLSYVA